VKIVNIVGARPNLMKLASVITEMRRHPELEPLIVHTGQHYDQNMSGIFFEELGIPAPDYHLGIGAGTPTEQTARMMLALEPLFRELAPDLVLVVGDVNSTVAAALVAVRLGIPIAHVEAGLRSFDREMPEEVNRILTDSISDYLFTTEPSGNENLRREGVAAEKVFFVGNVMIDTLLRHRETAAALGMPARLGLEPGGYGLVTLHRPSNVDDPVVMAGLLDALEEVQGWLPLVMPLHPRTRQRLQQHELLERLEGMAGVRLLEPLGYLEFLGLMAEARMVLTDSGGIQEETTILGVPCLTLRENTERPVTVMEGTNSIVGTAPEKIVAAARLAFDGGTVVERRPELWDGRTAERIVAVLLERAGRAGAAGRVGEGA
jgi:UDP-N-acetylglucosamine 2-epimerase (non-hydrolysing)